MQTFASIAELKAFEGKEAGPSAWHEVTQAQVQLFADATGDHQWIHLDPKEPVGSRPSAGRWPMAS